jgi:hypothetical protein
VVAAGCVEGNDEKLVIYDGLRMNPLKTVKITVFWDVNPYSLARWLGTSVSEKVDAFFFMAEEASRNIIGL